MHKNFRDALKELRASGGAMNYYQPTAHEDAGWEVGTYEALKEMVDNPRHATEEALKRGGMAPEQVAAELADWKSEKED